MAGLCRRAGLLVEVKAWSDLVAGTSPPPYMYTAYRGDTHRAFGNTEEKVIRKTRGVAARAGDTPWDHATGNGKVRGNAQVTTTTPSTSSATRSCTRALSRQHSRRASRPARWRTSMTSAAAPRTGPTICSPSTTATATASPCTGRGASPLRTSPPTRAAASCLRRLPGLHDETRRAKDRRAPPRHA